MSLVQEYRPEQLSDRERTVLFDLFWHTWPREGASYEEVKAGFNPSDQRERDKGISLIRYIIWDGNLAVAHTGIFARDIHTESGIIQVGALSGVCTHADYRMRGYGAQTVRAAFDLINQGLYPVSLWMTMVPGFYEKLGARMIHNAWINRKNTNDPTADPWPDEVKMIYPATYAWPGGVIDLNGNAY